MVAALCNDQTSDPTSSLIPTLWIRGGFCGPRNTVTHSRECLPKPCRTERKLVEIFHLSCRSLGGSWGGGALASLDLWYHASGDTNPLPESRLHTPLGSPRGASGAWADVQAQTLRLLDEGVSCGLLLAPVMVPTPTSTLTAEREEVNAALPEGEVIRLRPRGSLSEPARWQMQSTSSSLTWHVSRIPVRELYARDVPAARISAD